MKIQFSGNQPYQLDAIQAAVDLFEGQPLAGGPFEFRYESLTGLGFTEFGCGNQIVLSPETIQSNLRAVQERNQIKPSDKLASMDFSVEMETGTGKTYVYLRTLYELNIRYGFTKFVIVVPSVAIREGVLSSLRLTREHFQTLYGNLPVDAWVYDSAQVSRLRQFAGSNQMQVLVINIDAFNKRDIAVIHNERDAMSGRKPIEFIQSTRPIVIIDEPQNMESDKAKEAIASLHPLCTLRYSATHRNLYHQIYRLDPVRAYDLRLVKRIEVSSVVDMPEFSKPYIGLKSIQTGTRLTAKIEIDVTGDKGPARKTITARHGQDLFDLSNEREAYRGYIIQNIDHGLKKIEFSNGTEVQVGEQSGANGDALMRTQIRETVREHFEKELRVLALATGQRLKVLSLFFIDRVANYAEEGGKIRRWFVEAYEELRESSRYAKLPRLPVEAVHNGYFAQDRGKPKDTSGATKADDDAYELIMKDKERLLSLEEPLRFIFSHSALREGWDNPNVFQICTLNETRSAMRKRQEIGRGLRLPVRENGERCFDLFVNKLTVVANESYKDFAGALQREIEEECGITFGDRIDNAREKRTAQLKKGWQLDPDFVEIWERIKYKTRYSVQYETARLIESAVREFHKAEKILAPHLVVSKAALDLSTEGVGTTLESQRVTRDGKGAEFVPDLLGYLQRETELTRATLAEILIQSGRLDEVFQNPQEFLNRALASIRKALDELMVNGIKYEKRDGQEWEMLRFEREEISSYLSRLVEVRRSIYDVIEFDSEVEKRFAKGLDDREDVKLFFKLPPWFRVQTPMGEYNPDWAIVKEEEGAGKLYLVRETKGSEDGEDLRGRERKKIDCGKAHFAALGVDYKVIASHFEV
ncbi:MAG: DEAD/DEAH box helicase family protein [Bryobacteraceae bacterium]